MPGFGGFDVLGEVQYYAGTTQIFKEWLLVHADHGDIIGHFAFRKVEPPERSGRKYNSYDILESSSAVGDAEFAQAQFDAVWSDVFDFAVAGE